MGIKVVATNRKATHDYRIIERYESGIVLSGTEIKSIRNKYFTINCAPSNKELIKALKELGLELIQETYIYRKSY